jgi:ATP/maltotriose-dependent transcriptional regulator MalT
VEDVVSRGFLRGDPPWPERVLMYQRIDIERPNYRAALAECLRRGEAERGLRLCSALRSAWVAYGDLGEGIGWLDRFLALPREEVPPEALASALVHRAELAFEQQDFAAAARFAQSGLDMMSSPDEPGGSAGLRILGLVSLHRGRPDEALASLDAAVEAARSAGDYWNEGLALGSRAALIARLGQLAEAQQGYEAALDVLRDNNGWGIAQILYGFGHLDRQRGDNTAALRHFRDALRLYRMIDARPDIARCLAGIGWVALAQLDLELAASSLAESIQLSVQTGQRLSIARGIESFAALAVLEEDLARAVKLTGAGMALRASGQGLSASARSRVDALTETARQKLGGPVVDALVAEGEALSAYEAVAYALGLRDSQAGPPEPGPERPGHAGQNGAEVPAASRVRSLPGLNASGVLTVRELEIARLIARGLSNRGIADELTISPATVARHVANIFAKLGFSARSQVAAWAAERDPGSTPQR